MFQKTRKDFEGYAPGQRTLIEAERMLELNRRLETLEDDGEITPENRIEVQNFLAGVFVVHAARQMEVPSLDLCNAWINDLVYGGL